jgi:hypothetical protein
MSDDFAEIARNARAVFSSCATWAGIDTPTAQLPVAVG